MKSLSYSEFSKRVHARVHVDRIPSNGTIEITNRCPLNCSHCYNNLPMNDLDARRRELSTAEHYQLLDELADLGCLWLLFSGGEIFARRDFMDIYEYAKRKGFLITLFTNGTLIDERIADRLVELRPFSIEITLYGGTRETYEALTRIPGSYDRCVRGIDLLRERGLPLKLKTVAVNINLHELPLMEEFARSRGLEFKFDAMINPRIDCSSSPLATRLTPVQIVELDMGDAERIEAWRHLAEHFGPSPVPPGETPQIYQCGGGVSSFAVDPYGDLSICVLSHADRYNVRDGSFADGWNGLMREVRQRPITRVTKCTNCQLKSMCGMCAANGELENGDPEAPVDFLCHVAHLRAVALEFDVPEHGDCEYCGEHADLIASEAAELRAFRGELRPLPALLPTETTGCGGGCSSCAVK